MRYQYQGLGGAYDKIGSTLAKLAGICTSKKYNRHDKGDCKGHDRQDEKLENRIYLAWYYETLKEEFMEKGEKY